MKFRIYTDVEAAGLCEHEGVEFGEAHGKIVLKPIPTIGPVRR